jgi:hypothetical protein
MKCPKCRSDAIYYMTYDDYFDTYQRYSCENCDYELTEKECKEYEYQARLNKVLSKFYEVDDITSEYQYGTYFIHRIVGQDNFVLWNVNTGDVLIISLKTVESLLNDLEVK